MSPLNNKDSTLLGPNSHDYQYPAELAKNEQVVKYITSLLKSPKVREEDGIPENLGNIAGIKDLHRLVWGIRNFTTTLSNGNFDFTTNERGYIVGTLKTLQSNLHHLTWHLQCVAKGEFNHRLSFLGDFSEAFNYMSEQLDQKVNILELLSEEYKNRSQRDELTGLYNRYGFFENAKPFFLKNEEDEEFSSIIIADIDKFKDVNDTYGHSCGDEVLKNFSSKLISGLRVEDICCRYGGEEFVILMPKSTLAYACIVAERLRHSIANISIRTQPELKTTASFGIATFLFTQGEASLEEQIEMAIARADANMYKAKQAGRNRVVC